MKFHILIVSFFFGIQSLFSQQPAYFILGENEFEGVQIYDVIQDNDLNYWFATDQGFYKYNSYTFERIECADMKGLSAFGFVKNKEGAIFCYNLNSQLFKIENDVCSVFYEFKDNERASDVYLSITANNQLLVVSRTALLFEPSGKKIDIAFAPPSYYCFPFLTKSGRTISYMLGKDSLLIIDNTNVSFAPILYDSEKIDGVLKFFRMNNQAYAISTAGKDVYTFNENTFELKKLFASSVMDSKEFFRFYDENNQLWLAGTRSGVRYIGDISKNQLSETFYSDELISDVFQDSEGNLLLSTFNKGVLVIPDFEIPDVVPALEGQSVVSIEQDSDLGIVMGTLQGQLLSFQNNQYKVISNNGIRPLQSVFSWPNFPYIIFDDGQVKAYNRKTGEINTILEGSLKDATFIDEKNILIALNTNICNITVVGENSFKCERSKAFKTRTYSVELEPVTKSVFIATSEGLKILKTNLAVENATYKNEILFANDITADGKSIYVSTKNRGIIVFENDRAIQQISPILNQKMIEVHKLVVHKNQLYTLSSEGLVVFDKTGTVLIQLNKVQGFSTNKIFDFEIIDDQIWISHSKGVQKLSIHQLKNSTEPPLIKLIKIEVNDRAIDGLNAQEFDNDQRKFRFVVSSPTLRNKENIKYHYKLLGYEENWVIGNYSNNEIVYNGLGPGTYTFLIKVENRGKYSQTVSYSFSILSPIYLRGWFIIGTALLVILIITLIYRYMLNAQRKKSEMINELNFSKLTAIQSQMNPHFIFNALNSIQDLVLKGDIDNSYTFITKFSNLVRRTLNYSDKDFVDFEQEIKLLELYLSLEKLRFKKELEYTITIDNTADIMIPPLLVQPFIENALVHGLLHKEGSKKLSIHFQMKESLICTIEDNGIGREKSKAIKVRQRSDHESFSGKAILKRFEILSNVMNSKFGYEYEDLYENNIPNGTRVTLTIPVKHKF